MSENFNPIPKEKFTFVNEGARLRDKKFDDKPIGYFKDAWIRFRKNKASVVATVIIVCIILFAFLAPVLITSHEATMMDPQYDSLPPRIAALHNLGMFNGATSDKYGDAILVKYIAMGVGAEDKDGNSVDIAKGMASEYQPVLAITDVKAGSGMKKEVTYTAEMDEYLKVGFIIMSVEQAEYHRIVAWQEETGIQVLYPLIDKSKDNPYYFKPDQEQDGNFWYKANAKGRPVYINEKGKAVETSYADGLRLEENYRRDKDGNIMFWDYTGGGNFETAQFEIRVLYYNYYQYVNGGTPDYIFGTDAQGYDLALRIAGGIKLSLLIAVFVCAVNFILGAMYGAVEGYYGGTVDIILERVSDILANVPFIIVATLFQIHLAGKLGALPCLLFAYVATGWIGTASRVRTQFYRFKTQEYVMAARTLGARDRRIIWKHIFPNSLGTIITSVALAIPSTIMSESMLSFLGIVKLGSAKQTSLGTLLADASELWINHPHLMIYPALVISLLMICFNLFGNGLRDAFNPALRGSED